MMEQRIFANKLNIEVSQERIRQILLDGQQLEYWIPEISQVIPVKNHYQIRRSASAFNQYEELEIIDSNNMIIYHSTHGQLEYRIVFTFLENMGHSVLQQELFLPTTAIIALPFTLLQPILKAAFSKNLANLSAYAGEQEVNDAGSYSKFF
ncbi:hypothetical protein [Bombilactobacillus bombi]|uniref:hypothetical protein n=1 Tax=Bombilactobacillus bombi TaxID=1303590 RepID=UPI0015E5DCF5|nr:hypothetical protein [Bombilactobacillus bombi]MBA1433880.1 hypothetical protein [Bombilactobacillus bombi]